MTCHIQTKISNDDYDDNDNDANEAIQRKMYHCMYGVMFNVCCRGVWRLESLSPRQYSERRTSLYVLINTGIRWSGVIPPHFILFRARIITFIRKLIYIDINIDIDGQKIPLVSLQLTLYKGKKDGSVCHSTEYYRV